MYRELQSFRGFSKKKSVQLVLDVIRCCVQTTTQKV